MHDDRMLPQAVAEALEGYRRALAEHGMSWGEPATPYVRSMSLSRFLDEETFSGAAFARARAELPDGDQADLETRVLELDFDEVLRDALAGRGGEPPEGLAVLRLTEAGHRLDGAARTVLDERPVPLSLLVDNARPSAAEVRAGDRTYRLAPGGARLIDLDTATEVTVPTLRGDLARVELSGLTRPAPAARLRLRAGFPCRWSVWSGDGQGWYPEGAPPRRDHHGVPYFHGDDVVLDVPAEPLTVRVTRGMEYDFAERAVTPAPSDVTLVRLTPDRLYDAAAEGWYGGDLHVHLNFVGDVVATPGMAAAAQHGEDLHVLNLLAANVAGTRVLDREALEHWAGRDLPWSDATHVARMGVEYRNDLLGHLHAFGLTAAPGRYHSGFGGAPDWPPSGRVCEELKALGALVGYAHTFKSPIEDPGDIFGTGRPQCSARAAVVDAALGLVDGMEILHYASAAGSAAVYRRLLGAGNRLAAVAGTDSMLSFTRQRMEMVAGPPGWERTYAKVTGPLTAASYAEAVRRGRTFATTGPFVELLVNGHEPGDTVDLAPGDRVSVTARVIGPEVERLAIHTADGLLAEGPPGEICAEFTAGAPTYVVAIADGGPHPRSLYSHVFAHTSPVYVDVRGRRVAREEDLRWCLSWLELLEQLIRARARLDTKEQLEDHLDLIDEARRVYVTRLPR
ncbi:CehA/McbA family metallohydrolase [Sphaerisporangium fuscum]|uniref:CehA/McbA family metallohydrolase n=1 Tax=Sphaerisporangium fuscum TaxID=2835868 RepID=UPI0027E23C45|nr:CehA/McbA family metallohydrolase [Sphaerisporangium fuscum]